MVRYIDSMHLIPKWVHQFCQWHINMFESLDEAHQCDVEQHRAWIAYPHTTFEWLAPTFIIPAKPILVPVPPDKAPQLSLMCATLREPPPVVYHDDSPELSGLALHAKWLRTRSKSFIHLSVFIFPFLFIFLDFNDMPNDGVGWVAPHGNQRQTHQSLLSVHQTHCCQASLESQTHPLPKLIGLKELEELRHDVPPVSCFLLSIFISFY